jgi:hypothetical protein
MLPPEPYIAALPTAAAVLGWHLGRRVLGRPETVPCVCRM